MQEEIPEEMIQDVKEIFSWFEMLGEEIKSFTDIYTFLENMDYRNPDHLDRLYELFPEDVDKNDIEKIKVIMQEDEDEAVEAEATLRMAVQEMLSGIQELRSALEQEIEIENNFISEN